MSEALSEALSEAEALGKRGAEVRRQTTKIKDVDVLIS